MDVIMKLTGKLTCNIEISYAAAVDMSVDAQLCGHVHVLQL